MSDKNISIDDLAAMIKHGFDGVDKRFDKVEDRLESIEKLILTEHKRRIELLELQMRQMRDMLAIN